METPALDCYKLGRYGAAFFEHIRNHGFGGTKSHSDEIAFLINYCRYQDPFAEIIKSRVTGDSYLIFFEERKGDSEELREARKKLKDLASRF